MGTVDLWHSRRTSFIECKFWIRDDKEAKTDPSAWILQHKPSGTFYAKEISPQYNRMSQTAGVFAHDANTITLECDDDISDISRGCLVLYSGKVWMVNDVQKQIHRKESEFNVDIDYKYIVSIRR